MATRPTLAQRLDAFLATRSGKAIAGAVLLALGPTLGLPAGLAEVAVEYAYDLECAPRAEAPTVMAPVVVEEPSSAAAPEASEPNNTAGADHDGDAPPEPLDNALLDAVAE